MTELLGIVGTVIILLAFTFNSECKIRILDAVGAAFFVAYGIKTKTWSTVALNLALICVHAYKLTKR